MTLNGVMAVALRYFTEFFKPMYSAAVANVSIPDMGVASKFNSTCIEG